MLLFPKLRLVTGAARSSTSYPERLASAAVCFCLATRLCLVLRRGGGASKTAASPAEAGDSVWNTISFWIATTASKYASGSTPIICLQFSTGGVKLEGMEYGRQGTGEKVQSWITRARPFSSADPPDFFTLGDAHVLDHPRSVPPDGPQGRVATPPQGEVATGDS